jgi:transposase
MNKKVAMTIKEIKRLEVIQRIDHGQMAAREGVEMLGLSIRQTRRWTARYREQGAARMVRGNRGKHPPNRVAEEVRCKIEELCRIKYQAVEKVTTWWKWVGKSCSTKNNKVFPTCA